jgi:hypothetical protein
MFFEFMLMILNNHMFKVDLTKFPKRVQVDFLYFIVYIQINKLPFWNQCMIYMKYVDVLNELW